MDSAIKFHNNGFMLHTNERRGRQKHECIKKAGKNWVIIDSKEQKGYHKTTQSAQQGSEDLCQHACADAEIIKEPRFNAFKHRKMQRHIEQIVRSSVKRSEIESRSYFFVMVNYFTKARNWDVYTPAEIAVSQFSLREGVQRIYHTLVNPGANLYGAKFQTQQHANLTHRLPVPPKALGEVKLEKIYNDLVEFVCGNLKNEDEMPPVFTMAKDIPIVTSVLNFISSGLRSKLKVYSLEYLFFIMKEATCEAGGLPAPKDIYITNALMKVDTYEHQSNIGCKYHAKRNLSKYCAKSYVTRWGFMFANYMCHDLGIKLHTNRHMPSNLKTTIGKPANEVDGVESRPEPKPANEVDAVESRPEPKPVQLEIIPSNSNTNPENEIENEQHEDPLIQIKIDDIKSEPPDDIDNIFSADIWEAFEDLEKFIQQEDALQNEIQSPAFSVSVKETNKEEIIFTRRPNRETKIEISASVDESVSTEVQEEETEEEPNELEFLATETFIMHKEEKDKVTLGTASSEPKTNLTKSPIVCIEIEEDMSAVETNLSNSLNKESTISPVTSLQSMDKGRTCYRKGTPPIGNRKNSICSISSDDRSTLLRRSISPYNDEIRQRKSSTPKRNGYHRGRSNSRVHSRLYKYDGRLVSPRHKQEHRARSRGSARTRRSRSTSLRRCRPLKYHSRSRSCSNSLNRKSISRRRPCSFRGRSSSEESDNITKIGNVSPCRRISVRRNHRHHDHSRSRDRSNSLKRRILERRQYRHRSRSSFEKHGGETENGSISTRRSAVRRNQRYHDHSRSRSRSNSRKKRILERTRYRHRSRSSFEKHGGKTENGNVSTRSVVKRNQRYQEHSRSKSRSISSFEENGYILINSIDLSRRNQQSRERYRRRRSSSDSLSRRSISRPRQYRYRSRSRESGRIYNNRNVSPNRRDYHRQLKSREHSPYSYRQSIKYLTDNRTEMNLCRRQSRSISPKGCVTKQLSQNYQSRSTSNSSSNEIVPKTESTEKNKEIQPNSSKGNLQLGDQNIEPGEYAYNESMNPALQGYGVSQPIHAAQYTQTSYSTSHHLTYISYQSTLDYKPQQMLNDPLNLRHRLGPRTSLKDQDLRLRLLKQNEYITPLPNQTDVYFPNPQNQLHPSIWGFNPGQYSGVQYGYCYFP
ncbi:uncharacterized protein LOC115632203 [Scaptodrosophila lebanonensis]|uniref:Uncharacterized protein LOC115632203 n=1 Tax=Drosophila lebanonensis TaxID=7225 RepID=A0A6J2UDB3_DROLE|nr:uncharacterized protein LOC115632203 [Scaptodrosophila lebanonensis]